MIEHPFDLVKRNGREGRPSTGPENHPETTKHNRGVRRLPAVKRDPSSLLTATLRTGFMVGLAVILILFLLPAAIAAQAAGLR